MQRKRKIVFNLAMSLDGYIADENGGFDWIGGDGNKSNDTEQQFDFPGFLESVDTIIMGKKAFLDCPIETLKDFDTSKKIFVTSYEELETQYNNVKFISGDISEQVLKLREEEGGDIWIFGGAKLAGIFIRTDIIDEYIVGIIPIILGKGIRLFLEDNPRLELHLKGCTVAEGVTILRYIRRD